MQEEMFRAWMNVDRKLAPASTVSSMSRCRRVERHYGNLDTHYDRDRLVGLLDRLRPDRPNHSVPLTGNVRHGTDTLQCAIRLYRDFRDARAGVYVTERPQAKWRRQNPGNERPGAGRLEWGPKVDWGPIEFARQVTPYVQFLDPGIVSALVDDNRLMRTEWSCRLQALGIDPHDYMWDGSSCAFPGVRPRVGSTEPAAFRQQTAAAEIPTKCLAPGYNSKYPKHLWAFVFAGKPFRGSDPPAYRLAHLFHHRRHGNLRAGELDILPGAEKSPLPCGLFTNPACSAYVPSGYRGSVESSSTLRQLIQRRALQLYGDVCRIVPPPLAIGACQDPNWALKNFPWSKPVGSVRNVPDFLKFRRRHMEVLFAKWHAALHGEANR